MRFGDSLADSPVISIVVAAESLKLKSAEF